jgi:LiaI-LiaF-like transmembrane region/B-box zinc finger
MNCANHPQNPVAAYCRTCGKPLCSSCTRPVMGVVYCENCLAERVAGTAPPSPYTGPLPPMAASGPNPALAGLLGAIPFGVGAVYNGQYAKGLAHLVIFILLVVGAGNAHDPLDTICGLGIAAFVLYQIIDAVKTAKAIQAGQPAPDPFGLGTMFSAGDRRDFSRGAPVGALVLIALGVLFLLDNTSFWYLRFDTLWPLILIALGVWLFAKRKACTARGDYRHRSLSGPAILVTIGVISLLANLHDRWSSVPGWDRTWPVILLVLGIIKLMERGYLGGAPNLPPPSAPTPTTPPDQPPTEVNSEVNNG